MTTKRKPHVHAELIKAWADGAVIEACSSYHSWREYDNPGWFEDVKYRIKPEPKPDDVRTFFFEPTHNSEHGSWYAGRASPPNIDHIRCVFDGETGRLKDVSIFKPT